MTESALRVLPTETVAIADLRPHPQNYRDHPEDQLAHIRASLREHGQYRNVVVAREGTILAGHGVVEGATAEGWTEVTVVRLDLDPDDPVALKVLVGDNESGRLAVVDDRGLSERLREILEADANLLGTGFDEAMLANLVFVTRPAGEIASFDAAAHWVGLPGYDEGGDEASAKLVVSCDTPDQRAEAMRLLGVEVVAKGTNGTLSVRFPPRPREDLSSLRFE